MRAQINDYCARIAQNPLLVQGAGGNVSWKEGEVLWVKASGTWLRDANTQDIFVPVALPELRAALGGGHFDRQPRTLGEKHLKPSIETVLHALLCQKIVVHLHAIEPLSWLVRADAVAMIAQRMSATPEYILVPYRKPGQELAQSVHEALETKPNARVVLLMNHGVVIAGESVMDIENTLGDLLNALPGEELPVAPPLARPTPLPLNASLTLTPLADADLHRLATQPALFKRLQHEWALYPDHVVFLGARAITFDTHASAQKAASDGKLPSDAPVFIQNIGAFSLAPLPESKLAQLRCYQDLIERVAPDVSLHELSIHDIASLLNWDAERYRQQLNN